MYYKNVSNIQGRLVIYFPRGGGLVNYWASNPPPLIYLHGIWSIFMSKLYDQLGVKGVKCVSIRFWFWVKKRRGNFFKSFLKISIKGLEGACSLFMRSLFFQGDAPPPIFSGRGTSLQLSRGESPLFPPPKKKPAYDAVHSRCSSST